MKLSILLLFGCVLSGFSTSVASADTGKSATSQPNIVFILTDDHRWDSFGAAEESQAVTLNLDQIAGRGTRFSNAFVTLAICAPSRAACLTGRYGSATGITSLGKRPLNPGEQTFAQALGAAGYATGVAGKWHLKTTPRECGFDFASVCYANGTWYDRKFSVDGKMKVMPGFVDDVAADESIRFIDQAVNADEPFVLWMCTQVPHMDHKHTWPAKQALLDKRNADEMPVPETWDDDLSGKPDYLMTSRSRKRALKYGYDDPENIRNHTRDYLASIEQMDAAVGRVLAEIKQRGLSDNTWIIFMGDNGWFMGEHGFTSKVLPYEESMRVPMAISGPGTKAQVSDDIVLNIDLTATIYQIAGLTVPAAQHGRSLLPIVQGKTPDDWRNSFLYEAPASELGSQPLWAIRNDRWKYIETQLDKKNTFTELYDLSSDAIELKNVVDNPANQETVQRLAAELRAQQAAIAGKAKHATVKQTMLKQTVPTQTVPTQTTPTQTTPTPIVPAKTKAKQIQKNPSRKKPAIPATPPPAPRTDLFISGVYPHLTAYGVYSQNGAHYKSGHDECGIGAIVPWAGKLWMVNYAPHQPGGSEHKLFSVDPDLSQPITVHPESVGGTPAGRMIHAESKQLFIGHHIVDANGKVRSIQPQDMPIRVTAIARHLVDPVNMVYYVDMEGSIWEANVHTLAVKQLFKKPVPGWHGKGAYTSQGRLVVSNNGEHRHGSYKELRVGGEAKTPEERGVLAQFDGTHWTIVERRQFTEVTGPKGITGGSDGDDPIWTMGWDRRSIRLKVLDQGTWHTYLLPKAAYCNDAKHGWYTEWPRIRETTQGRWMMDMHGMFFDFPKTFSAKNSAGIKPIGSHLRYVPDFCGWNEKLVLATDETSIQGNKLAGQPQTNLWFGDYEDLKTWGPASGYGGPWIQDKVTANVPSDPFLVAGFDRRMVHLAVGSEKPLDVKFSLEVDQQGTGQWEHYQEVIVPADGNVSHIFPADLDATWMRFKTDRDCVATAMLHQTTSRFVDGRSAVNAALFSSIADVEDTDAIDGLLYAAKRNRNLRIIRSAGTFYEFSKDRFEFTADGPDAKLKTLLHVEQEFSVDAASVVLKSKGQTYRLPKGHDGYDQPFASGWPRVSREVESERHLANIHGTFYEVPLIKNGKPPLWNLMRPVSSHRKQITDFCTWNGLLVLSGIKPDAANDGHIFRDSKLDAGLWFGAIDDLWKLGKPVGHGGPWLNTEVKSSVPSDPYLMTGYDKKSVQISHSATQPVTITLEVDIDGNGLWVRYKTFEVAAGATTHHEFPTAFSARWVRAVSNADTSATVQFDYQ